MANRKQSRKKKSIQRRSGSAPASSQDSTSNRAADQPSGEFSETTLAASSGPIPEPDVLEAYDRFKPGLADVIVESWQDEMTHRRAIENKTLDAEIEVVRTSQRAFARGQWCALAVAIGGMTVSGMAIAYGHVWAAGTTFVITMGSIVGAFLKTQAEKARSTSESREK